MRMWRHKNDTMDFGDLGEEWEGEQEIKDNKYSAVYCSGDECTRFSQISTKELTHVTKYHLFPKTPIEIKKI